MDLKKVEEAEISYIDIELLACQITGVDFDDLDGDSDLIEQVLINGIGIDIEQFKDVIVRVLPLIMVAKSPLTGIIHKGFVNEEEGIWITKIEA